MRLLFQHKSSKFEDTDSITNVPYAQGSSARLAKLPKPKRSRQTNSRVDHAILNLVQQRKEATEMFRFKRNELAVVKKTRIRILWTHTSGASKRWMNKPVLGQSKKSSQFYIDIYIPRLSQFIRNHIPFSRALVHHTRTLHSKTAIMLSNQMTWIPLPAVPHTRICNLQCAITMWMDLILSKLNCLKNIKGVFRNKSWSLIDRSRSYQWSNPTCNLSCIVNTMPAYALAPGHLQAW